MANGVRTPLVSLLRESPAPEIQNNAFQQFRQGARLADLLKTTEEQRKVSEQTREIRQTDLEREKGLQTLRSLSFAARDILPLLEADEFEAAGEQLEARKQLLQQSGIDSSNTEQFQQLLASDPLQAIREAETAVKFGREQGFFKDENLNQKQTSAIANFREIRRLEAAGDKAGADELRRILGITQRQKLSAAAEKELFGSQNRVAEIANDVNENNALIGTIQRLQPTGGLGATVGEAFKRLFGTQDAISQARTKFNKIRTSVAVNNLPPGTASDADVALALQGVPPTNAPASQMEIFFTWRQ